MSIQQQHKQQMLNNNNKNSLELSESELDKCYGDNALINMKTDFYNDDFYDYKDTFLNKANANSNKVQHHTNFVANGVVPNANTEIFDDDYGEEEDDIDDNNDFNTGPLAIKKSSHNYNAEKESEEESGYENAPNNQYFDENGIEFDEGSRGDMAGDYDEQENILMMDTFFKRVDSLELSKPKKAKIVHNYLIGDVLGDGSYGKVKECIDLATLSRRAVKIINLKMIARKIPRGVDNVRKEINIMKRLNHKNLIKLYDIFEKSGSCIQKTDTTNEMKNRQQQQQQNEQEIDQLLAVTSTMVNIEKPPKLYIFMDYCMTSLEKLLKNAPDKRLHNWQANHYFKQLIEGLEYLHSLNIIHNDIKPGNLLITCDDTLKICDFSISAELNIFYEYEYLKNQKQTVSLNEYDSETEVNPSLLASNNTNRARFPILQCTPMFQCPEMLDENIDELLILKNAPKIDVWSSGITLYQLTTGQLPFEGQTIHQIFENIRSDKCEIKLPDFVDKNLRVLLVNMLNRDIKQRWSLKQIRDCEWVKKKHPFIQEDLAQLPEEVIQNEFATFRMINYLEKLCQLKTPAELTSDDFNEFYDEIAAANANHPVDRSNEEYSQQFSSNNEIKRPMYNEPSFQQQTQKPNVTMNEVVSNNKNQSSKQFSQAAKVKRSHCLLM